MNGLIRKVPKNGYMSLQKLKGKFIVLFDIDERLSLKEIKERMNTFEITKIEESKEKQS